MGDLTRNFSTAEFDRPEIVPTQYRANIPKLAALLQWLRDGLGVPGVVSSTYRSPARNASVGGSATSQHLRAEASDVTFVGATDRDVIRFAFGQIEARLAPAFGQLIVYTDTSHTHISLPTLGAKNGEILLAYRDATGERRYRKVTRVEDVPGVETREVLPRTPVNCPSCGQRLPIHPD